MLCLVSLVHSSPQIETPFDKIVIENVSEKKSEVSVYSVTAVKEVVFSNEALILWEYRFEANPINIALKESIGYDKSKACLNYTESIDTSPGLTNKNLIKEYHNLNITCLTPKSLNSLEHIDPGQMKLSNIFIRVNV